MYIYMYIYIHTHIGAYLFPTPDSSSPDTSEGAAEGATIVIAGVAAVMTGAKSVAPEVYAKDVKRDRLYIKRDLQSKETNTGALPTLF